ncbi:MULTISPECIES: helix-turn-helix transcriptional regulator [Streptomyces]|uniref:Helix-turn-helix transcriptional regulator n=1 Tax=Streptomyces flavovirens TaxID=52258 RepID=A0ABV8MZE9_9ACTN|nr:YafY family protein [Streptomyces sp. MBT51]MBK3591890.1 YafY family transcriptional regulator [Streptomyces sp. MBT51]
MSRPVSRVLTLLELLQSGGVRTVSELAERLDVDERTVRRYVGHLLDLDVPVESVRGRYGGYRLTSGYRMPPLMLSDDEALAVLLGLVAGQRAGLTTATGTASETAAAKVRRVLPERLARRLDSVLGTLAFTAPSGASATPDTGVLLSTADAVRHHRPLTIRYTAADGRRSERTLHPYGLVAHSGRWYVTGMDPAIDENRTFRLDRITGVAILPGSFEPPAGLDPAERVLSGFATAAYRHEVVLRIQGTPEQIRTRLPAGVATVRESPAPGLSPSAGTEAPGAEPWCRVELRVERLDWLPGVLASLDQPFVIERPDELRGLVEELADRLTRSARRRPSP